MENYEKMMVCKDCGTTFEPEKIITTDGHCPFCDSENINWMED